MKNYAYEACGYVYTSCHAEVVTFRITQDRYYRDFNWAPHVWYTAKKIHVLDDALENL